MLATLDEFPSITFPREVAALGKPDLVYTRSGSSRDDNGFPIDFSGPLAKAASFFMLVVALGLFVLSLYLYRQGLGVPVVRYALLLMGAGFFAIGSYGVASSLSGGDFAHFGHGAPDLLYALFPEALACRSHNQWRIVRWNDVVEFHGHSTQLLNAKLKLRDGSTFEVFHEVNDADDMLKEIEFRTFAPIRDTIQSQLEAGVWLHFGPLVLSRNGLQANGKTMPWSEIGKIDIATPPAAPYLELEANADATAPTHVALTVLSKSVIYGTHCFSNPFFELPNRAIVLWALRKYAPPSVKLYVTPSLSLFMPDF